MDNLTIFANKAEYEKNRINLEYPNVSFIEEDLNTITKKRYSTGHVDKEGLKAIGWSDDDIKYFDYKGVNWDEAQDAQNVVPQADKNLMPMDKSKIAGAKSTMKYCPYFDTSQETSMGHMFENCSALEYVPKLDTSYVTDMEGMFSGCTSLIYIPILKFGQAYERIKNIFKGCTNFTYFGGFEGLADNIDLSESTKLTHESLMNIINLAIKNPAWNGAGDTMTFGAENLAKLTEEEKAIATNKGWTLA